MASKMFHAHDSWQTVFVIKRSWPTYYFDSPSIMTMDGQEKEELHLASLLVIPDPTVALMLATLRWPDNDERRTAISAAVPADIDWARFLALAARHRVTPLAFQGLAGASLDVPRWIADLLIEGQRSALFAELRMAGELIRLQNLFQRSEIDCLALKGPTQSLRSFGRLGLRINRDIDILISNDDVGNAQAILLESGYALCEPSSMLNHADQQQWVRDHKDMVFRAPDSGALVELHWRLFDNPALMPPETLSAPVGLGLAPLAQSVVLPNAVNFRYLCHHGAQHGWSRLKWLADVNALLPSLGTDQIRQAYQRDGNRTDHAVGQALILCQQLFDAKFAPDIRSALERPSRAAWLARLAWSQIVRCDTAELETRRFGSTIKNASHYALHDGWRYWYEELRFDLGVIPRNSMLPADSNRGRLHGWIRRHLATP